MKKVILGFFQWNHKKVKKGTVHCVPSLATDLSELTPGYQITLPMRQAVGQIG